MLLLLARPDQYPEWLPLFKSDPGERWITVHPNGRDEPGQAVLIRESHTKPGTYHVIAGADGKLTHLTLDHVGTRAEWNQRAKDKRAKAKAEGREATPETKTAIKEAKKKDNIAFVNRVADQLGWDKNWYKTAEDYIRENPTIDPLAAGLAANDNLNAHVKQARQEIARYERRLTADAEARSQAGLGDLSLDNNPFRATTTDLAGEQIRDKILHHGDEAVKAEAEERALREQEAKAYEGLAATLATMPDDATSTEIGAAVERIGQPNTDEARAALAKLRTQDITPEEAASQLQGVAADTRSGKADLTGGGQARHHQEVRDLYNEAQRELQGGDEEAATRHIEHAKRLTGDYNVGALDLVGAQAQEGTGYKPVARERARADIAAKGEDTPEAISRRIEEVTKLHDDLGRDSTGIGAELQYGVNLQRDALLRAQDAAAKGDTTAAADHLLDAQKYEVYTADLADKAASAEDEASGKAKVQGAIDARRKILAAHKERAAIKATGGGGASGSGGGGRSGGGGSGGGRSGGGAAVDDDTLDMSKAVALLKIRGAWRDRQKQLDQAKRAASIDPDAFKTALKDPRVDETPITPEEVARIAGRIRGLADAKTHSALIDMVENPGVFQAAAGEDQVRAGSIGKWVDLGRDAMTNLIGQLAGDGVEVDRAKFSALGLKEGCQLLAQHLANTMTEQRRQEVLAGLEHYHSGRALNVASGAMRAAEECLTQAKEFEMRGQVSAYDLSEVAHYNRLRMECVDQALASVGSAYGELNATAEMIWALGGTRASADQGHTIAGGTKDRGALVVLARSLGLEAGEYGVNSPKYDPATKESSPGNVRLGPEGAKKLFRKKGMGAQAREATLAAIKADPGQDDYLPKGIARRPASTFDDPEKRPDRFADAPDWRGVDFASDEGEYKLKDYLAGRLADGIAPEQLYAETRSQRMMAPHLAQGKQTAAYRAALSRVFPEPSDEGWNAEMEGWARDLMKGHGGGDILADQTVRERDPQTIEAAHRALARDPWGAYAFHKVEDLDASDQAKIRQYAYKHLWGVTGDRPQDQDAEQAPPPQADDFGNIEGDSLPHGVPADPQGHRWDSYVKSMGGREAAYTAILHHIKGDAMREFAETYGQVTGTALRTGTAAIPGGARFYQHHADDATHQRIEDGIASASDPEKLRGTLARQIASQQPQRAMPDRTTIGATAESRLAGTWRNAADAFTPGKPVDLLKTRDLSMSGKYVNQQRAVKAIRAVKRLVLAMGVGSGKTAIMLGSFTDANQDGEASHSLISCPQNMVSQFGSEAATYLDPSKGYKWFAKPGASAEERRAKLASKEHHFVVTTHESLRDDVVHAVATHRGISKGEAEDFMRGKGEDVDAEREGRVTAVHDAFAHLGWDHRFQHFCVDEGHKALNRQGKEDSLLAHCLDGISDNAKHYIPATGTPVKNDLSEAYDSLTKIDRKRFPESGRADWLRNNGGVEHVAARIREMRTLRGKDGAPDTPLAGQPHDPKDWTNAALAEVYQRALAPYMFQTRVPLDQPLTRKKEDIHLSESHQRAFDAVTEAYARANKARSHGTFDAEALHTLSPNSFADQPESAHPAIAQRLHEGMPMVLRGAYNRVLHGRAEDNSKLDRLSEVVGKYRKADSYHRKADGTAHKGKPVIVFAHNHDSIAAVRQRLEKDGHRVGVITGEDAAAQKDAIKLGFQPANYKSNLARGNPDTDAKYDVLVASDAVSQGGDMPRAEAVVHYDIPDTAAVHEQRTARAHRLSSEHPVEMTDLVSHTPYEQKNWLRLKDKYALSDVSQNPSEKADDTGLQYSLTQGKKIVAARRERQRQAQRAGQRQPA